MYHDIQKVQKVIVTSKTLTVNRQFLLSLNSLNICMHTWHSLSRNGSSKGAGDSRVLWGGWVPRWVKSTLYPAKAGDLVWLDLINVDPANVDLANVDLICMNLVCVDPITPKPLPYHLDTPFGT